VLLATLPAETKARRLAFDTSGHVSGDYESSVSYLSLAFTGPAWSGKPPAQPPGCVAEAAAVLGVESQRVAHDIARRALEAWVREGERFDARAAGLPIGGELSIERGVFVTLEKHGQLRGCIGNLVPRGPLYETIVGRAIDASSRDSRFDPVTVDELGDIEIEISVLTLPQPVSGPEAIVLGLAMLSNMRYARLPRIGFRTWPGRLGLAVNLTILGFGIFSRDIFFFPLGIAYAGRVGTLSAWSCRLLLVD